MQSTFYAPGFDAGPAPDLATMAPEQFDAAVERHRNFGLTDEQLGDAKTLHGAGLERLWQFNQVHEQRLLRNMEREPSEADEQAQFDADQKELGAAAARRNFAERLRARDERRRELAAGLPPLWLQLAPDLAAGRDHLISPNRRAAQLAKLLRSVTSVLRQELRHANECGLRIADCGLNEHEAQGGPDNSFVWAAQPQEVTPCAPPASDPSSSTANLADPIQNPKSEIQNPSIPQSEIRNFTWDPLRGLCAAFGLALNKLSRFSKEISGLSANELIDQLRAEQAKPKLRAELKLWLLENYASARTAGVSPAAAKEPENSGGQDARGTNTYIPSPLEGEGRGERSEPAVRGGRSIQNQKSKIQNQATAVDACFAALQATRRSPRFHRATWAANFGFSSYQKFFRGCLYCHGQTPHQLELELLEELLQAAERDLSGLPPWKGGIEGGHPCAAEPSTTRVPSPLEGEGRHERSECGVRGNTDQG